MGATSLFLLRLVKSNEVSDRAILVSLLVVYNVAAAFIEVGMMSGIGVVAANVEQSLSQAESKSSIMGQGGALANMAFAGGLMLGPIIWGLAFQNLGWNGLTLIWGLAGLIGLPGTIAFAGNADTKTRKPKEKRSSSTTEHSGPVV